MNTYYCIKFHNQMTCDNFYYLSKNQDLLETVKNDFIFYQCDNNGNGLEVFQNFIEKSDVIAFDDAIDDVTESKLNGSEVQCLTYNNTTYVLDNMETISFRF